MSTRTPKEVIETVNTIGAGKIAMSSGKKVHIHVLYC